MALRIWPIAERQRLLLYQPPFTLVTLHRSLPMGEGWLPLVPPSTASAQAAALSPTCMHDPCKLLPCQPCTVHPVLLTSAAPSGTSVPPWPAAGPGQQRSTALAFSWCV